MSKISDIFKILFVLLFFVENSDAQTINWSMSMKSEQEYPTENNVRVFLDDTNYYISRDYLFEDSGKYYMQYFMSTSGLEYEFQEGLPDGCYILIGLTRKEAKKLPEHIVNRYIVASGCFENGMKQGKFTFSTSPRRPDEKGTATENKPVYKSIEFLNDTVNGNVQEYFDMALYHLAQYKMGKLDGYFILAGHIITLLKLYQEGILIKETLIE